MNGYFIWLLNRIGNFDDAAQKARDAAQDWVALKVADGRSAFNVFKDKGDLVGPAVDSFRRRKLSVWGWHYVYGNDPVQEAIIAEKRAKEFGLDGYIINAEVEYKNKPYNASVFMKELRKRLTIPITICSFRFPQYHREFPWAQFLTADYNMPQVYWMGAQNAGDQLITCVKEFKKYGSTPIIPVGAAFSEWGWTPSAVSIEDFRRTAEEMKLQYVWWEWYEAVYRNPKLWDASNGLLTVEAVEARKVKTSASNLRCRTEPNTAAHIVTYLKQNKVYTSSKMDGVWFFIDDLGGWAHGSYLEVVS